jgi:hypothetical protein
LGPGNTVILTGSIAAVTTGAVGRVSTGFAICPASTLMANCNAAGTGNRFSDASPTPVPVVAGQIIQITVTFSFS